MKAQENEQILYDLWLMDKQPKPVQQVVYSQDCCSVSNHLGLVCLVPCFPMIGNLQSIWSGLMMQDDKPL